MQTRKLIWMQAFRLLEHFWTTLVVQRRRGLDANAKIRAALKFGTFNFWQGSSSPVEVTTEKPLDQKIDVDYLRCDKSKLS